MRRGKVNKAGFPQPRPSSTLASLPNSGSIWPTRDSTTTEDGAYTITAQGIVDNSISRNIGATVFVPNEAEWYKAAYYNGGSSNYYVYPAGSSTRSAVREPELRPIPPTASRS